ncbi:MAG: SGNH/GDSL hydrolase family protein, partial [Microcystaceae cyanobacterium]
DLVLLAIFTGNDLVNNSKALSQGDRFAPFLVEKNGKFEMNFSFRETETYHRRASGIRQIGFYLINNSRVLQVINEAKRALTTRQTLVGKAIESDQKEQVSSLIPALDFDVNLYREPQTENWRSAWIVTEELLKLINQEVKENNSQFLAVTISNPPQVYPDAKLQAELTKQGVTNIFYPDRRIAQWGESNNFDVLNLAPSFQAYAYKNQVFLHGFDNTLMGIGHWNKSGHQLAGKLITEHLCYSQKRSPIN